MRVIVLQAEVRFYEQDGWTARLLSLYVTKGSMVSFGCDSTDTKRYWTISKASAIDSDKMFFDGLISEVMRHEGVEKNLTDTQAVKVRSWLA